MKRFISIFFVLISAVSFAGNRQQDTLRILGVGNSWTRDAMRWISAIAQSADVPVIVGHAYLGGSTLKQQFYGIDDPDYEYIHSGRKQKVHATYQYWKYNCCENPEKTPRKDYKNGLGGIGVTLENVVADEPWDIIVFQPEGTNCIGQTYQDYIGMGDEHFDLNKLKARILKMMDQDVAMKVKIGLMVPFSYPKGNLDHRISLVNHYNGGIDPGNDQKAWDELFEKQHAINQQNSKAIATFIQADYYINVGAAVYAARQDEELNKSGFMLQRSANNTHLSEGLAMYVASLAYAYELLGLKPEDILFYPKTTADMNLQNTPELAAKARRTVWDACHGASKLKD